MYEGSYIFLLLSENNFYICKHFRYIKNSKMYSILLIQICLNLLNNNVKFFSLVQRKDGDVVIHGDIWANNYLFSKSDDQNCFMVDWQFTTTGKGPFKLYVFNPSSSMIWDIFYLVVSRLLGFGLWFEWERLYHMIYYFQKHWNICLTKVKTSCDTSLPP